jgi:two-component system, sensor histidine kinase and response regulator
MNRSGTTMQRRHLTDCVLLLVDDEEANLDLLESFLEPDGYTTLLRACDGAEAIALFEECRPDIVLLDLHMPRRSGFDVLRDLQQRREPGDFVPVLVLTADSSTEARTRALSEGAHDYLTKPLDRLEVRLRVKNLLRTRLLHLEQRLATYAREQVLSVVAHDLRNPLSSIMIDAEMLRHVFEDGDGGMPLQSVLRIERTVARMHRLIEDLLEVTRLHHGTFAVHARSIAPAAVFTEAESMLRPLAEHRDVTLSFGGAAALDPIRVDPERIVQALSNLVGNSLKFTPAGGSVSVSWTRREAELLVTVADTGEGIADEELPHVFSPFWQAGGRKRRGGLGLGLVIARAIIAAHGGRIWIESAPGAGTRVYFTIPFAEDDGAAAERLSPSVELSV